MSSLMIDFLANKKRQKKTTKIEKQITAITNRPGASYTNENLHLKHQFSCYTKLSNIETLFIKPIDFNELYISFKKIKIVAFTQVILNEQEIKDLVIAGRSGRNGMLKYAEHIIYQFTNMYITQLSEFLKNEKNNDKFNIAIENFNNYVDFQGYKYINKFFKTEHEVIYQLIKELKSNTAIKSK